MKVEALPAHGINLWVTGRDDCRSGIGHGKKAGVIISDRLFGKKGMFCSSPGRRTLFSVLLPHNPNALDSNGNAHHLAECIRR